MIFALALLALTFSTSSTAVASVAYGLACAAIAFAGVEVSR